MSPAGVPGVVETVEAHGETTLVVDPARVVEACTHLRDTEGYNVLVDLSGVDYLGWGTKQVAGYIGTPGGRDIHVPGCPPRPEALMEGIVRLHEKIRAGVPPAYEIRGVAE